MRSEKGRQTHANEIVTLDQNNLVLDLHVYIMPHYFRRRWSSLQPSSQCLLNLMD